jgi:hypothetical protein
MVMKAKDRAIFDLSKAFKEKVKANSAKQTGRKHGTCAIKKFFLI